jgi:hypothetical protein
MKRIKYVSQFSRELEPADLTALEEQCVRNNQKSGITGVLMVSGNLFFQVLEGPEHAVDGLFESILHDDRHTRVLKLADEQEVRDRLFPDWAMKVVSLDPSRAERLEPLHALLQTVVEQKESINRLTNVLERAIWNELAYGSARVEPGSEP